MSYAERPLVNICQGRHLRLGCSSLLPCPLQRDSLSVNLRLRTEDEIKTLESAQPYPNGAINSLLSHLFTFDTSQQRMQNDSTENPSWNMTSKVTVKKRSLMTTLMTNDRFLG